MTHRTLFLFLFLMSAALNCISPGSASPTEALAHSSHPVPAWSLTMDGEQLLADPQRFTWPTGAHSAVLHGFDPPTERWKSGHRGVDLALTAGSPVYAAGSGVVVFAGKIGARNIISLEHTGGLRTTYEPVTPQVKAGQTVSVGDQIGVLEPGHLTGQDALHWGAKYPHDAYINPLSLLNLSPIRLWE